MAVPWKSYAGIDLWQVPGSTAYTYTTSYMEIDADGAPNAYHPADIGLDYLANAGYPNGGWRSVLVTDPNQPNEPFRQITGPFSGYFISKTSLQSGTIEEIDPERYVDAVSFPYIVFPGGFYALPGTGTMGDLVIARVANAPDYHSALVADGGPFKAPLGEVSIRLATDLGGTHPNPRTGAGMPKGPFQYLVFPGSRTKPAWRRDLADITADAEQRLTALGGWPAVQAAVSP